MFVSEEDQQANRTVLVKTETDANMQRLMSAMIHYPAKSQLTLSCLGQTICKTLCFGKLYLLVPIFNLVKQQFFKSHKTKNIWSL